ncbi:MAG: hypothetical protein AAF211_01905 [Myxococcota bacterium]
MLVLVALITLIVGFPYFATPEQLRPTHELHEYFGGGGIIGLLVGLVGTGLMLVLLLYSVRKWLPFLKFMGDMQFWMTVHVVAGLLGPAFIVLHGGFAWPRGFIGIGFWCMVLVALSGFFGRYLFGYFPSATEGLRVDLRAAQKALTDLRAEMVAQTKDVSHDAIGKAVRLVKNFDFEPQSIGELVILDAEVRRRADLVKIMLHRAGLEDDARTSAEAALTAQLALRRSLAGWNVARRLLRYWNLFHQPLALAMYLISAVHIFNAFVFGRAFATLSGS